MTPDDGGLDYSQMDEVGRMFSPLLLWLRITAVYGYSTGSKMKNVLYILFAIFIGLCNLLATLKYGMCLGKPEFPSITSTAFPFITFLQNTWTQFFAFYTFRNGLPTFLNQARHASCSLGLSYTAYFRKRLLVAIFTVALVTVAALSVKTFTLPRAPVNRTVLPCEKSPMKNNVYITYAYIYGLDLMTTWNGCVVLNMVILQFAISSLITREFQHIYKEVSQYIQKIKENTSQCCIEVSCGVDITARNLERFRFQHDNICRLLEKADDMLMWLVGPAYACCMAVLCFLIHSLVFSTQSSVKFIYNSLTIAAMLLQVVCFTYNGIRVKDAASLCLSELYTIDVTTLSTASSRTVQMFIQRLTVDSVGYTVLKVFFIDRNTILTIIGTLLSYTIVLIQFK